MSPTDLRARLEELVRDLQTGDVHPLEVRSALGEAFAVAGIAEKRALCQHQELSAVHRTTPRGRFCCIVCDVCGFTLSSESE